MCWSTECSPNDALPCTGSRARPVIAAAARVANRCVRLSGSIAQTPPLCAIVLLKTWRPPVRRRARARRSRAPPRPTKRLQPLREHCRPPPTPFGVRLTRARPRWSRPHRCTEHRDTFRTASVPLGGHCIDVLPFCNVLSVSIVWDWRSCLLYCGWQIGTPKKASMLLIVRGAKMVTTCVRQRTPHEIPRERHTKTVSCETGHGRVHHHPPKRMSVWPRARIEDGVTVCVCVW